MAGAKEVVQFEPDFLFSYWCHGTLECVRDLPGNKGPSEKAERAVSSQS